MSMMWKALIALAAVALTGCTGDPQKTRAGWCVDQEKRIERFDECLKLLPYGPDTTVYNDWSEVVGKCDEISHAQAKVWRPEGCEAYLNAGAKK